MLGSYNKMEMYASELAAVTWSVIVWDEGWSEDCSGPLWSFLILTYSSLVGHTLKNDITKGYKAAAKIKMARSRIMLTGTPIQNKLEEFWCLLNLVSEQ